MWLGAAAAPRRDAHAAQQRVARRLQRRGGVRGGDLDASALPPIFIRSFEVLDAVRDAATTEWMTNGYPHVTDLARADINRFHPQDRNVLHIAALRGAVVATASAAAT